jgi:mRNA interferase MazF
VMILTRDAAIPVLSAVVVAPITRTVREIASEVLLGIDEGLPDECVAVCDSILTIPKSRCDEDPVGRLDAARVPELDAALRFALGIWF